MRQDLEGKVLNFGYLTIYDKFQWKQCVKSWKEIRDISLCITVTQKNRKYQQQQKIKLNLMRSRWDLNQEPQFTSPTLKNSTTVQNFVLHGQR